jgi:SPP1 gp7 family putative phage head morphogenesis protein
MAAKLRHVVLPEAYYGLIQQAARSRAFSISGISALDQLQGNKDNRSYLLYDAINDSRSRENHRLLDGFIAPIDDPAWRTIYPPNGHNCRCTAISLTEKQAIARGWKGTPKDLPPEAGADEGWDYNPASTYPDGMRGEDRALEQLKKKEAGQGESGVGEGVGFSARAVHYGR